MNQIVTTGIVLKRTNYGEADRILTILTPDYGKIRVIARGVRRIKAKLAGGIELFSVSTITFIRGKGDLGTLTSARLDNHYDQIAKSLDRTMQGYEYLKDMDKLTEDEPERTWFDLLKKVLVALDEHSLDLELIRFWFLAQVLRISGYTPNLYSDIGGNPLEASSDYIFNIERMTFEPKDNGSYSAEHIKLLRLALSNNSVSGLKRIKKVSDLISDLNGLMQSIVSAHLKIK